jgi:O-antigen ligase
MSILRFRGTALSSSTMLHCFWVLLLFAIALSVALSLTPWFIAATSLAVVVIALLLSVAISRLSDQDASILWRALLTGILLAALINAAVAFLQVAAPRWHDDVWIAQIQGERAFGNLRQPNLLALLSLWGLLFVLELFRGATNRWLGFVCAVPLFAALWWSGSRAGWLGLSIVVACAAAQLFAAKHSTMNSRAPGASFVRTRFIVIAMLAVAAIGLIAAAVSYFSANADRTTALLQRVTLWRDVWQLIEAHPLLGVGFGQLNFAWTLTPLPNRSQDVFDHAHNLPLHWAAEFGIPIALLLLALLAATLIYALRTHRSADRLAMLALIAVALWHSMSEYPLWFAHFLLPTAVFAALLVRAPRAAASQNHKQAKTRIARSPNTRRFKLAILSASAALLCAGLFWVLQGYRLVAAIYTHGDALNAAHASATRAQQHGLYGYYGDYAKVMLEGDAATSALFVRAPRSIIDEKLLTAWARALAREGRVDEAAYIVARAREFPQDRSFANLPVLPPYAIAPQSGASSVRRIDLTDFRR